MKTWSIYSAVTGEIVKTYNGPADWVALNTPEGCSAIEGEFDAARVVIDPATRTAVDREQISLAQSAANALAIRAARLRESDWVTLRAADTGAPLPAAWQAYRQALRDITKQPGWPLNISWPALPE